jgi:ankyrin repeat protein
MDVMTYIMSQNLDVNVKDYRGRTAIEYTSNPEMFAALVDHGAKFNSRERAAVELGLSGKFITELMDAAQKHASFDGRLTHFETAKYILRTFPVIDEKDSNGETLLMVFARDGEYNLVWWLLLKGANPNIKTKSGHTAYDLAVLNANGKLMGLLKNAMNGTIPAWLVPVTPAMKKAQK